MKFSSVAQRKEIFIREMIESESLEQQIKAYRKAYPKCRTDNTARVNSYKLLQDAEISEAIHKGRKEKEEIIKEAKKAERIRIAKESIADELEIDSILSSIALGLFKRKRKVPVFNHESKKFEIISVDDITKEKDIIAAADKLYKRKGSYPNIIKHEVTGGGGKPIEVANKYELDYSRLSDEALESIINSFQKVSE